MGCAAFTHRPKAPSKTRTAQAAIFAVAALGAVAGCDDYGFVIDSDGGVTIGRVDGGTRLPPVPSPVPAPLPPGAPVPATTCQMELRQRGVAFAPATPRNMRPVGRPDMVCTVDDPVDLQPVVRGLTFRPSRVDARPVPIYASCALALQMDRMAERLRERGVTDVVYYAVYSCRVVAGTSTLSEHARARALDVAALRRADGSVFTVLTDWEKNQPVPISPAGRFLRETVVALFEERIFNIVLTPDYNADHANHFHLDLTPDAHIMK